MTDEHHKARLIMALRHNGIRNNAVLEAIESIPRDLFVPQTFRDQAWADMALPISCGQTISQPYIVAYMTEMLELKPNMRVLEIGTGSGYQAAILSRLARRVYTMERHRSLLEEARKRFEKLNLRNIETRVGDGSKGWPEAAPFDRIIVTAAAPRIPPALLDQLGEGGVMIIPVDSGPLYQKLVRVRRTKDGFEREDLLPVRFVPLLKGIARED
jgi:protein-L-isoaspartate(D-aspartate) O-methyltransferase